jgi:hypothetical protein
MPTLDGIEIEEVHEVNCAEHGRIGAARSREGARTQQRIHFEWRHQPDPTDRACLWRYPLGGGGAVLCQLHAAHDGMHRGADGQLFGETGSLPREE